MDAPDSPPTRTPSTPALAAILDRCAAAEGAAPALKTEAAALAGLDEPDARFALALVQLELARKGDAEARAAMLQTADSLLHYWRDRSGDELAEIHPALVSLWGSASSILAGYEMAQFKRALATCWEMRKDAPLLQLAIQDLAPEGNRRVEFAKCLYHLELARMFVDESRAEFAQRAALVHEAYHSKEVAESLVGDDEGLSTLWKDLIPYLDEFFESVEAAEEEQRRASGEFADPDPDGEADTRQHRSVLVDTQPEAEAAPPAEVVPGPPEAKTAPHQPVGVDQLKTVVVQGQFSVPRPVPSPVPSAAELDAALDVPPSASAPRAPLAVAAPEGAVTAPSEAATPVGTDAVPPAMTTSVPEPEVELDITEAEELPPPRPGDDSTPKLDALDLVGATTPAEKKPDDQTLPPGQMVVLGPDEATPHEGVAAVGTPSLFDAWLNPPPPRRRQSEPELEVIEDIDPLPSGPPPPPNTTPRPSRPPAPPPNLTPPPGTLKAAVPPKPPAPSRPPPARPPPPSLDIAADDYTPDAQTLDFWRYTESTIGLLPPADEPRLDRRPLAVDGRAERKKLNGWLDGMGRRFDAVPEARAMACLVKMSMAAQVKEKTLFGAPNPKRKEAFLAAFQLLTPDPLAAGHAAVWFALDGPETLQTLHSAMETLQDFLQFCARNTKDPLSADAAAEFLGL